MSTTEERAKRDAKALFRPNQEPQSFCVYNHSTYQKPFYKEWGRLQEKYSLTSILKFNKDVALILVAGADNHKYKSERINELYIQTLKELND